MSKRPLIGYFCQNEFQGIAPSRVGASLTAKELGYDLIFFRDWNHIDIASLNGLLFAGRIRGNRANQEHDLKPHVKHLYQQGLHAVAVHLEFDGVPSILPDNHHGIRLMVHHLYKQGHRHFTFVHGWLSNATAKERFDSFKNSMIELGIPAQQTRTIDLQDQLSPDRDAIHTLLNSQFEREAVVCWNDISAIVAVNAALRAGRRIPEEMAITGFDNIEPYFFAGRVQTNCPLPLTTYDLPSFKIGRQAVLMVDQQIRNGRSKTETKRIQGQFIEGATSTRLTRSTLSYEKPTTSLQAFIAQVEERFTHIPKVAVDALEKRLQAITTLQEVSSEDLKNAIIGAIDSGFDIHIAYPIYLNFQKRTRSSGPVSPETAISLLQGWIDEKEPIHQIYHFRIPVDFNNTTQSIRELGKQTDQLTIARLLREILSKLGVQHSALIVLSTPCSANESPQGQATIWDLLDSQEPTSKAITLKENFKDLLDAAQDHVHPRAQDALILKNGNTVYGALLVDIDHEYWILQKNLADLTGHALSYSSIFEALSTQTKELRIQKSMADAANRTKDEFLKVMSHELRTPLNCIIGLSEITMLNSELKREDFTNMDLIKKSGHELLEMIEDILLFAELESEKYENNPETLNLNTVLADCFKSLQIQAEVKGLEYRSTLSSEIPRTLIGDAKRIRESVKKILSNAIKFTHTGSVRLKSEIQEQSDKRILVRITIEDTGIGIQENQSATVFEKFSQIDSGSSRRFDGMGVSLAIVSRLAEKMGGKIWFQSEEGAGTQFFLELPFEAPRQSADQ